MNKIQMIHVFIDTADQSTIVRFYRTGMEPKTFVYANVFTNRIKINRRINGLLRANQIKLNDIRINSYGYSEVTYVPVEQNNLPIVAAGMFETLRGWCALWDTVEEWINESSEQKQGDKLYKWSMKDRKEYMRLSFGDRVDRDPLYKDID